MKKNILAMGLVAALSLSALAGCTGGQQPTSDDNSEPPSGGKPASSYVGGPSGGKPVQKPVVNFEGVVAAVEDGAITLENGTVVRITDSTEFAPDPDSNESVSREITVGNYIQGYTEDDAAAGEVTASNIWTNDTPAAGGKLTVNFEGRITAVEDGKALLEDGTVVLTDSAEISAPDGSAAEIAVGDYIQGYAENPDAAELNASSILITAL